MARKNEPEFPAQPPSRLEPARALAMLKAQLSEIGALRVLRHQNDSFQPWREKTKSVLRLIFGEPSLELERFNKLHFSLIFFSTGTPDSDWQDAYVDGMKSAKAFLDSVIFEFETRHSEAPTVNQKPRLKHSSGSDVSPFYFVAHEYSASGLDDLRSAISDALTTTGLMPYFADKEIVEGQIFLSKILPKIIESRFGIYDISNPEKPNVFIELGAAIACNCPYYIVARKGTAIPSDLQGLDRIEYQSFGDLRNQLREKITL